MSQPSSPPENPHINLTRTADYRDSYANSVQVRLSVWDFLLVFGTLEQRAPDQVQIDNFQGIYLSPQQAKALHNVLSHNLAQYEEAFGPISLDSPKAATPSFVVPPSRGPVH